MPWLLAVASLLAMFFFQVSFPWIVVTAAAAGWLFGKLIPAQFPAGNGSADGATDVERLTARSLRQSFGAALIWLLIWFAPVRFSAATCSTAFTVELVESDSVAVFKLSVPPTFSRVALPLPFSSVKVLLLIEMLLDVSAVP